MSEGVDIKKREETTRKKKTYKPTRGCLFNPSSTCISALYLPLFFTRSLGLFVSFAGRMSACPTDEFIFVHAFRLHRQEIYARIAVRGELLSAPGIIHTPRLLDEELTTGDVFVFRLNAEGLVKKYILYISSLFRIFAAILFSFLIFVKAFFWKRIVNCILLAHIQNVL